MGENNRWGVYSGVLFIPIGIGLIEDEFSSGFQIRYSEGQMYPSELWSRNHVKVFDDHLNAVKHYSKHKGESEKEALEDLTESFPSIFQNK